MTKLMTKAGIAKSANGAFSERRGVRQIQSGTTMNRFRLLAIGTMFIVALTAPAQQTATGPGGTDKDERGQGGAQSGVPKVEQQMKVLTEKLDLTNDQQARIKPILQELHDATQKLMQDESEKRLDNAKTSRERTD